eukprot:SAG22_NODE_1718_length_3741_cov_6.422021_1_plen_59_part_00
MAPLAQLTGLTELRLDDNAAGSREPKQIQKRVPKELEFPKMTDSVQFVQNESLVTRPI